MSKGYFSYIRVSTVRQGQTGTSLTEQREAIQRYASRWNLRIVREFEETETAAKSGRPLFRQMLAQLRQQRAAGVIIHKIDRSARNLRDWAELGEIIDYGIEVHFANENLDLESRGGRLSADIQAVVAADFIRNLREEVRKGYWGRIKQGLYPRPAPPGYINKGAGKPKEPHPIQGPLVRSAFELYASGNWGINGLVDAMFTAGLRNRSGSKITRNGMAKLLRNHFYAGIIKLEKHPESFIGQHQPLIPRQLFERVQRQMDRKAVKGPSRHEFIFSRLMKCNLCGTTLIAETRKGYVYYRCHNRACTQKSIREEAVIASVLERLSELTFTSKEQKNLQDEVTKYYDQAMNDREARLKALSLQLDQSLVRNAKLTDAYLDGVIDQDAYQEKRNGLLLEQQTLKDSMAHLDRDLALMMQQVQKILGLANDACLSWKSANTIQRREFAKIITSDISINEELVLVKLRIPFQLIADRHHARGGRPQRALPRTRSSLISQLFSYFESRKDKDEIQERVRPVKITPHRLRLAFRRANEVGPGELAA